MDGPGEWDNVDKFLTDQSTDKMDGEVEHGLVSDWRTPLGGGRRRCLTVSHRRRSA